MSDYFKCSVEEVKYQVGRYIADGESLILEFKELRLNNGTFFYPSEEEIKNMIECKNWDMIISETETMLQHYINNYVPKYAVGFANGNLEKGTMYIGVADSGEIVGFPLSKNLLENKEIVQKWVNDAINRVVTTSNFNSEESYGIYLDNISDKSDSDTDDDIEEKEKRMTDEDVQAELRQKIKAEVIVLDENSELIDDNIEEFIKYWQEQIDKFIRIDKEYHAKRRVILEHMDYYRRKIEIIINELPIRQELIQFVFDRVDLKINPDSFVPDEALLKVSDELINNPDITFYDHEISKESMNPYHVAYWITRFRDYRVIHFKNLKPVSHMRVCPRPPYTMLLQNYQMIVKRMMETKEKIAIVKITFPGSKTTSPNFPIISYLDNNNKEKTVTRLYDSHGNPCCV